MAKFNLDNLTRLLDLFNKSFYPFEKVNDIKLTQYSQLDFLKEISNLIITTTNCDLFNIFMETDVGFKLVFAYPADIDINLDNLNLSHYPNGKNWKVINQTKRQKANLSLRIKSNYLPTCHIVFEDGNSTGNTSIIFNNKNQNKFTELISKLKECLDIQTKIKLLYNRRKITDNFFNFNLYNDQDITSAKSSSDENYWTITLDSVFVYMSLLGPLSEEINSIRSQLFTVNNNRKYLTLQAESYYSNGKWRTKKTNINLIDLIILLERYWTVRKKETKVTIF